MIASAAATETVPAPTALAIDGVPPPAAAVATRTSAPVSRRLSPVAVAMKSSADR